MIENEKRWNLDRINSYCKSSGFTSAETKAIVLKQLTTAPVIERYLDTLEGAVMMDSIVELVRDSMMKIVKLSVAGFDLHQNEIKQAALQIAAGHKFMYSILTALADAKIHNDGIEAQ